MKTKKSTSYVSVMTLPLVVAAMAMGLHTSSAVTLISDDFESYTLGAAPVGSWSASGGSITVETSAQSAFGPISDTQGTSINDNSAADVPSLTQSFTGTTEALSIQFDYRYTASLSGNPQFQLRNNLTQPGARLYMGSTLGYRDGSSNVDTGFTLTQSTWYHFALSVDAADGTTANKWSFTVQPFGGSVSSFSGIDFQVGLSSYNSIEYNVNAGVGNIGSQFDIDNVLVATVPEPATWALLAMGLMTLIGLRRRLRS